MSQLLFSDDTVLDEDSKGNLERLVDGFGRVCMNKKLKMNDGKSKVMRLEMRIVHEEVEAFKYLGTLVTAGRGVEAEVLQRSQGV
mgnify:CR=1 FL=1